VLWPPGPLRGNGRKFLLPIYTALIKTPDGAALARRIYKAARPTYHPVSQASLDELLK